MSIISEKQVLIIGDPALCLIGAAAGTDYVIFSGDCRNIDNYLRENKARYGVIIMLRSIAEKCRELGRQLETIESLVILVDTPETMEKIDPRKYYEELMKKFVGMKISL